jgi:hypothetical protein
LQQLSNNQALSDISRAMAPPQITDQPHKLLSTTDGLWLSFSWLSLLPGFSINTSTTQDKQHGVVALAWLSVLVVCCCRGV